MTTYTFDSLLNKNIHPEDLHLIRSGIDNSAGKQSYKELFAPILQIHNIEVLLSYGIGVSFTDEDYGLVYSNRLYRPKADLIPFSTSGTWVGDDEDKFNEVLENTNIIGYSSLEQIGLDDSAFSVPSDINNIWTALPDNSYALILVDGTFPNLLSILPPSAEGALLINKSSTTVGFISYIENSREWSVDYTTGDFLLTKGVVELFKDYVTPKTHGENISWAFSGYDTDNFPEIFISVLIGAGSNINTISVTKEDWDYLTTVSGGGTRVSYLTSSGSVNIGTENVSKTSVDSYAVSTGGLAISAGIVAICGKG